MEHTLTDAGAMLADPLRQVAGLRETAHRPWPLPRRPWIMGQTWRDLLFAHWRVDPDELRAVVPTSIPLDVHDGACWVGVTPFEITGLHVFGLPPLPWLSHFPELNVRTYATVDGRPGIWFLSLDAARNAAVHAARRTFRLPYFHARMDIARQDSSVRYASDRAGRETTRVGFRASYRPTGPISRPVPGSLEYFLTERYCLYALDPAKGVLRADIHHPPWPLQPATAAIEHNSMLSPFGLELRGDPVLHFAPRQDVLIWSERPVTI